MGAPGGSASAPGPSAAADDALDILREGASPVPSPDPSPGRGADAATAPDAGPGALGDPARHSAPESDPAAYSSDDDDDDDRADRRRDNKRRERPTPSPSPDPSPDRRRARAAPPARAGPGPGRAEHRATTRANVDRQQQHQQHPFPRAPRSPPRSTRAPFASHPGPHHHGPGAPPPYDHRRGPPPVPPGAPFGRRADPDPGRRPSFDRQPERPGVRPPRGSSRDRASYPPRGADHHREHHHRAGGPDRPRGIGIAPHPHQRHHQIQTHPIGVGPDRDAPSDSGTTADPRDLPARFEDAATIFLTRSQLVSLVDALGADASAAQRAEALASARGAVVRAGVGGGRFAVAELAGGAVNGGAENKPDADPNDKSSSNKKAAASGPVVALIRAADASGESVSERAATLGELSNVAVTRAEWDEYAAACRAAHSSGRGPAPPRIGDVEAVLEKLDWTFRFENGGEGRRYYVPDDVRSRATGGGGGGGGGERERENHA